MHCIPGIPTAKCSTFRIHLVLPKGFDALFSPFYSPSSLFVFSIFFKAWDSLPLPQPHPVLPCSLSLWSNDSLAGLQVPKELPLVSWLEKIGRGYETLHPKGAFSTVNWTFRVKGMMLFPGVKLWLFLLSVDILFFFCHCLQNTVTTFSLALELS